MYSNYWSSRRRITTTTTTTTIRKLLLCLVLWFLSYHHVDGNQNVSNSSTTTTTTTAARSCDETKCRNPVSGLNGAFDCWAQHNNKESEESLLCADGYIGHVIDIIDNDNHDDSTSRGRDSMLHYDDYYYYTCCPPDYEFEINDPPKRECDSSYCTSGGDDCLVVAYAEAPLCNQESAYNTSRFVTTGVTDRNWPWGELIQYTCCTKPSEESDELAEDYDEVWTNDMEGCSVLSCISPGGDCLALQYGMWMELISCDQDSNYPFPRIFDKSRSILGSLTSYSCCETVDEDTEYYIENKETRLFRLSFIGPLVLSSLVFLLVVGFTSAILTSPALRKQAFTLYVVSLQFPDAMLNMTTICYMSYRLAVPSYLDNRLAIISIYGACGCVNVWINILVTREIFILLLRSSKRMRTNPPTTQKVKRQIGVLYFATITIWSIFFLFGNTPVMQSAYGPFHISSWFYILFGVLLPFAYLSYVCFRIWREKLLPRTGRTRGITLYFARIVIVFYVMYIPAGLVAGMRPSITIIIISLQAVVSIAAARTSDEIHNVTAFLDIPFQRFRRASSAIFASSEFFTSAEFRIARRKHDDDDDNDNNNNNSKDGNHGTSPTNSGDGDNPNEDPWARTGDYSRARGVPSRQRIDSRTGGVISLRVASSIDFRSANFTSLDWPESEEAQDDDEEDDIAGEGQEGPRISTGASNTMVLVTPGCFANVGVSNANLPFSTCKSSDVIDA